MAGDCWFAWGCCRTSGVVDCGRGMLLVPVGLGVFHHVGRFAQFAPE